MYSHGKLLAHGIRLDDSHSRVLKKLQFISSSTFVSTVANSCRVSASAAQGTAANTWVRRQELWESPCFAPAFGTTLDLSQIPLSWQLYRFPSLSLSSFHQCWQQNCRLHSALINNLRRKTTKLANWHTRSTLTVRVFFHSVFISVSVLCSSL